MKLNGLYMNMCNCDLSTYCNKMFWKPLVLDSLSLVLLIYDSLYYEEIHDAKFAKTKVSKCWDVYVLFAYSPQLISLCLLVSYF
jgi:hypothetical protein